MSNLVTIENEKGWSRNTKVIDKYGNDITRFIPITAIDIKIKGDDFVTANIFTEMRCIKVSAESSQVDVSIRIGKEMYSVEKIILRSGEEVNLREILQGCETQFFGAKPCDLPSQTV